MTSKDYVAIARILSDEQDSPLLGMAMLHAITRKLADYFEVENERFDRQRFLTAAGYREDGR